MDATGFDYAWGQVPQMPADYPVDKDLHEKVVGLLREKVSGFNIKAALSQQATRL